MQALRLIVSEQLRVKDLAQGPNRCSAGAGPGNLPLSSPVPYKEEEEKCNNNNYLNQQKCLGIGFKKYAFTVEDYMATVFPNGIGHFQQDNVHIEKNVQERFEKHKEFKVLTCPPNSI